MRYYISIILPLLLIPSWAEKLLIPSWAGPGPPHVLGPLCEPPPSDGRPLGPRSWGWGGHEPRPDP